MQHDEVSPAGLVCSVSLHFQSRVYERFKRHTVFTATPDTVGRTTCRALRQARLRPLSGPLGAGRRVQQNDSEVRQTGVDRWRRQVQLHPPRGVTSRPERTGPVLQHSDSHQRPDQNSRGARPLSNQSQAISGGRSGGLAAQHQGAEFKGIRRIQRGRRG